MPAKVQKISPASCQRLQKIIAGAGLGSRRQAESWITDGEVCVNGVVETRRGKRLSAGDVIELGERRGVVGEG